MLKNKTFKNNDPKMVKCYRHKEWVLLSITCMKFWEITTVRTSMKRKLNQLRLSRLFDKLLSFCNKHHVQLRRHRETIIVVIWCTYI